VIIIFLECPYLRNQFVEIVESRVVSKNRWNTLKFIVFSNEVGWRQTLYQIWNHLDPVNFVSSSHILLFKIFGFFKWPQMEKWSKPKLWIWKRFETLQLITFSFEIIYGPKIQFEVLTFWNSKFLNDLRWRTDINQSCRSRRTITL
jgi:hypothetical protein